MANDPQTLKKQPYKVGQILAIPLPDGRYAYGKVFNDLDVGVYDFLSDGIETVDKVVKSKILFYNGLSSRVVKNGDFPVIGVQTFADEESAWAPPMVMGINVHDHSDGNLNIAHKGDLQGASQDEAKGLEIRFLCQRADLFVNLVVDRLVNKNHRKYRYMP
jgi:Immunity protein 26